MPEILWGILVIASLSWLIGRGMDRLLSRPQRVVGRQALAPTDETPQVVDGSSEPVATSDSARLRPDWLALQRRQTSSRRRV